MHQGNLAWTSDSQQTSEGVPLQSWDPVPSHMAACTLELKLIIKKYCQSDGTGIHATGYVTIT